MKKTYFSIITLSLTMLLSISCSKDEDPAPLPETPIEPEVVLTDYSEAMNDYAATKFIFKFKPNNLDGFIVPDTIRMMLDGKKMTFPDGSFATLSPDRQFTVKGETARQNVISMLDRMERYIVSDYPDSDKYRIYGKWPNPMEQDSTWFSCLREGRLWVGLFSYQSGEQHSEEYYSNDIFKNEILPYKGAYGIEGDAPLDRFVVKEWFEDFFLLINKNDNKIILWKNGKVWAYPAVIHVNQWYEGSYLIVGREDDGIISRVYSKDGDIVIDYVQNKPIFTYSLVYPISHEDYLEIDNNYIYKKSLLLEDSQWWASIPIKNNNSSKYEHSFVSKDENLYTFKVVETTIQGERKEQQYVLNIDTHEVNLL